LEDAEQISFDVERLELEQRTIKKQTKRLWVLGFALGTVIVTLTWFSIPLWEESKKLMTAAPTVRQAMEETATKVESTRKELAELSGQWVGVQKKFLDWGNPCLRR